MILKAEVIAIGDELTCGQRVDTNSAWLSQQLELMGVEVLFHTTVGDTLADNVEVFRTAVKRANLVVSTGGLGPTADDLTRFALAEVADAELIFNPQVLEHIRNIFASYGREMPESNRIQAQFPCGAIVIDNPEGTAPGIELSIQSNGDNPCRIFALPGVPAEMKQMWAATVGPAIQKMTGEDRVIHHHILHCFGVGESQTELMLPEMTRRGRTPRVGITASQATISLRITTHDVSVEKCLEQMQPTIEEIRMLMGDLLFGENGQELQDVVIQRLKEIGQSVAVIDLGLQGDVAKHLASSDPNQFHEYIKGSLVLGENAAEKWLQSESGFSLTGAAKKIREIFEAEIGVAIGPVQLPTKSKPLRFFELAIETPAESFLADFEYAGHSNFRHLRSVKQVLNQLRLRLAKSRE